MHIAFDMLIVEYESHEILYFLRLLVDVLTTTYYTYTYTIITSCPKAYDQQRRKTNVCIYPVVISSRQGLLIQHQLLLARALRKIKPDLLHTQSCIAPVGWQGAYILMASYQPFLPAELMRGQVSALLYRHLLRESLRRARFIIALSQEIQQVLVEDWSVEQRIIRAVVTNDEEKILARIGQIYAEIQAAQLHSPLPDIATDSLHIPFDTIPSVSVVMPTTRPQKATQALHALCKQAYVGSIEIIVVGLYATQLCHNFPIHAIDLDQQVPPGRARNLGAHHASGKFLLFIDDDMIMDENWVVQNVTILQEPHTGTVGARMPGKHTTFFARCADFTNYGHYQHPYAYDQATGSGSMGIARSLFVQLGGFDENLYAGEDIDLCYRVQQQGYRTRYSPAIVVLHDHNYLTLRRLLSYNYQHGCRTDLARKLHYRRNLKNRMLVLVRLPYVFLLIFPFIAFVSALHIIVLNMRSHPRVLFYAPFIFLGKLAYEYGILVQLLAAKRGKKI